MSHDIDLWRIRRFSFCIRQLPTPETVAQLLDVARALDALGTGGTRMFFDYIGNGVLYQSMYYRSSTPLIHFCRNVPYLPSESAHRDLEVIPRLIVWVLSARGSRRYLSCGPLF